MYHKWDVKNGFDYVLQFFSLISDVQKLEMEASKMISRKKIHKSFRVKLQTEASVRSKIFPTFEKSLNLQECN